MGAVRGRHRRWPELQWLLLVRFLGFPVWDTLILPIVELIEVRQLRPIDIVRISPRDGWPGRLPPKELKGAAVHHFGAFFDRPAREHDVLWGRLDGAQQLLNLVAPDLDERWCRAAFQAVLEEEGPQLPAIQPVIREIRDRLSSEGPQPSSVRATLGDIWLANRPFHLAPRPRPLLIGRSDPYRRARRTLSAWRPGRPPPTS